MIKPTWNAYLCESCGHRYTRKVEGQWKGCPQCGSRRVKLVEALYVGVNGRKFYGPVEEDQYGNAAPAKRT